MAVNQVRDAREFLTRFGTNTENWTATYYANTADWEQGRKAGWGFGGKRWKTIGASDIPAAVSISPWKSRRELWEELTGRRVNDFHGNEATDRGHASEPHIRALWAIEHPEFEVFDGTGIIFRSKRAPFLHASLDGIAVDRATGEIGTLEIKSYSYSRAWNPVPEPIFVQVLAQSFVLGGDFAIVRGRLLFQGGECVEREAFWNIADQEINIRMNRLVGDVAEFYSAVENDRKPTPVLAL